MGEKIRESYKFPWQEENFAGSQVSVRGRVCKLEGKNRESYKFHWREENFSGCWGAAEGGVVEMKATIRDN